MPINKIDLIITAELVQIEAKCCLDRELSPEELEGVFEALSSDWSYLVQDKIHEVIDFNELLVRNEGAENDPIRFDAWHRNENAYQPDFALMGSFKTEEDARAYAAHDFITEFDEWKVVRIEGEKTIQVWSINIKD